VARPFYPIRDGAGSVARLILLAQITDPHIDLVTPDDDAADALAATVAAVMRLDPPPDAVLVSGDLTNDGDAPSYALAAELLAPLPMPVHVLAGNHDDRAGLRAAFPGDHVEGSAGDPFRWAVDVAGLRLVGCDTTVPGAPDGAFDADARAWLAARLAEAPDVPTIVALHHPPVAIGIPALDEIRIPPADADALAEVLAGAPQVRRVVCGHVHRGSTSTLGGVPVFTCPSVHLQAVLDLAGSAGRIMLEPGAAPAFAVHVLLDDGTVVSHVVAVR
jgi:3',5'-cyclic-AMP phosphodiesterase